MLLRIAGMFVKPVAAAIAGTLLCVSTLGVFVIALALANNDRRAEARAERADLSAGEHGTVSGSSALDDTTTPQAEERDRRQRDDDALGAKGSQPVVQGCSSPPADKYGLGEESKNPPPEPAASPSWLTRVIGSSFCLEEQNNAAEAL